MPRCPEDSKYEIIAGKLSGSGWGRANRASHRGVARRVNAKHFFPVHGGEDVALGYGVPHCGGEPPALDDCSRPLFLQKSDHVYYVGTSFSCTLYLYCREQVCLLLRKIALSLE